MGKISMTSCRHCTYASQSAASSWQTTASIRLNSCIPPHRSKLCRFALRSLSTAELLMDPGEPASKVRRHAITAEGGGGAKVEGEGEKEKRDPVVVLGEDIMTKVMGMLDARSVARSIAVSHQWQVFGSSDEIWKPKCEQLWKGKAHIPHAASVRGATMIKMYSLSSMDCKRDATKRKAEDNDKMHRLVKGIKCYVLNQEMQIRIMKEDLCDHVWEFRFKELTPPYWLELDPSWTGTGPAMRRYFHPDGFQSADPMDPVWGGQECRYSIVTSFADGKMREHYVRINRWPKMCISRREDWSWMMANDFYYYTSIPDADKEGGTGPQFPFW